MESHRWMPIVIVHEPAVHHVMVHPDTKPPPDISSLPPMKAWEQRIGTAILRPDGSFDLFMSAVPLYGNLRMRPPKEGEQLDPMRSREE